MRIAALGPGDDSAVDAAAHLFDDDVDSAAASRFLGEPGHHLLVAYDHGDRPVGFISGVELTHPDKGTEMFLYELGVDEAARRRGIGRALVEALAELARERGCYGMFVLTDDENAAALATYKGAGAGAPSPQLMLDWNLRAKPS
jgi:ribosomal protein S18 acetylase RimI-like enzyme